MRLKVHNRVIIRTACVIMLSLFSSEVWAYLDPSTGSMVVSALVGILASAALAVKTYWYKLKSLLRQFSGKAPGVGKDTPPEK